MDDISEYRRKHREAYLKRVASAAPKQSSSADSLLDDGFGKSTSCNGPEVPSAAEADAYEQQLSDKFKRDRYASPVFDEDYESSLELAKKLQREFDAMDEVRRPDDSYKECLLSEPRQPLADENPDVELQKAIAKSLIDM